MSILDMLDSSLWTTTVLFIISVMGVVLTVVFYLKSRRYKKPMYRKTNIAIVGDKTKGIDGLSVAYAGKGISTFSVAKFALWNAGNKVIEATDVAPSDPIRIAVKEGAQILDAKISYVKRKANNFTVSVSGDRRKVTIGFDYFHKSEGLVIEVYHTEESKDALTILGTIKGVNDFTNVESIEDKYLYGWFDALEFPFTFIKNEKARFAIVFILVLVTLPIYIILRFVDGIRQLIYRAPKEYDLRD